MARAPGLSAPSLSPFGSSGASFGAFTIADSSQTAYLEFLKKENAWQAGQLSDADYIAALRTYVAALPAGSSNQLNAQEKLDESIYRVGRNVLVKGVNDGTTPIADLLAFDQKALTGLNVDSQQYRDRLDTYQSTQDRAFSDAEQEVNDQYQKGLLTSQQLQTWYLEQRGAYGDNRTLADQIDGKVDDLDTRILSERDAKAVSDYNDGKLTDDEFLTYANAARARYATGTTDAQQWDDKINAASVARAENGLLYRYGLSQQYAQLEQFIASNSGKTGGGTSTSTSTRIVLGTDGQWHTITSTSTKAVAPTAAEQQAYRDLQVQLADAKAQMAAIANQIGTVPGGGGWVTTDQMIAYYQGRAGTVAKGSGDWFAFQQKIDSLVETAHKEAVLSQQGIRITYPGQPAATTGAAAASSISVDAFLASLARVESGGNYTARNKSTGAYGKYQIMPANWPAWAGKYLGSSAAPQTPENQDKVARAKAQELYNWLGSWEAVAYWWNNGGTKATATNPANWTAGGRSYVNNVMGGLGVSVQPVASSGGIARGAGTAAPSSTTSLAGSAQQGPGGLTTLVAVNKPSAKWGTENLTLAAAGFPVNYDSAAFEKFYAAYAGAFKSASGEESFSYDGVTYFIGSNPVDRVDRMRQLDGLRISLYTTQEEAYAGTPREITASAKKQTALNDWAAHEYQILDTATKVSKITGEPVWSAQDRASINPIAGGVLLLDQVEANIKLELQMAQEAYDRGDVTAAAAHLQLASHATDPGINPAIDRYLMGAVAKISGIQGASEGITPQQAGVGARFTADLERLQNHETEIKTTLAAGDKLDTELAKQTKINPTTGEVTLADGWARFINTDGKVKIDRIIGGGVDEKTGTQSADPAGKFVKTLVKIGSTVEDAYAAYTVTKVGWINSPDGTRVPLYGKQVEVADANGKLVRFYENPLDPGHWSDVPIAFNTPQNFGTTTVGTDTVVTFRLNPLSPKAGKTAVDSSITYSLRLDPTTGTYLVVGNRVGGFLTPEIKDLVVGNAGAPNVLELLKQAGFSRDATLPQGGFTDINMPTIGMTPEQRNTWLFGRQPPTTMERFGAADMAQIRAAQLAVKQAPTTIERFGAADMAEIRATQLAAKQPVSAPTTIERFGAADMAEIRAVQAKLPAIQPIKTPPPPPTPSPPVARPSPRQLPPEPRTPAPAPAPVVIPKVGATKLAQIERLL